MRVLAPLRRRDWRRRGVIAAGVFIVVLVVFRLTLGLSRPSLSELLPNGELRVGIDASNPPFAASTPEGYAGLEVALSQAIAEQLEVPLRLVGLGYDGLYDTLAADQVDVVIASVPIDVNRMAQVTYSEPYYNAGLVLVSDQGLMSMHDLPGKILAFEYGSIAHAISNDWLRQVAAFDTLPAESPAGALEQVRAGTADAALVDSVSLRLFLRRVPGWQPKASPVTDVLYAAVTRADRGALSSYIGEAMAELLRDGTVEVLIEQWL
ncbi:MAG: amino acid ABC transporter substrate-binding protein [Chloroflexi bacterium]|nr:amino acid ABC transporter substrate-binding protein [Chloroflexota bacterium]